MTLSRWLALVVAVALAACGSDKADVSDVARNELQPRVAEIRELADAKQADQVQAKLTELRLVIGDLLQRGELTGQGADDLRAAATNIESQLDLITTTTQPPPPRDEGDDEEDEENEHEEDD